MRRFVALASALAVALACSTVAAAAGAGVEFELTPRVVAQGGLFLVTVVAPPGSDEVAGAFEAGALAVFPGEALGEFQLLGGVGLDEAPGPRLAVVRGRTPEGGAFEARLPFTVRRLEAPSVRLAVAPRMATPAPADEARIRREAEEVARLTGVVSAPALGGPFRRPVAGVLRCPFGQRRLFNGATASVHQGVDLRAAEGAPVRTANAGRVALARDLYFAGKAVIMDHGAGLFTLYAHLSALLVAEGALVPSGATLGLAGATGRVTGPHLHWGLKLGGRWQDPLDALALPLAPAAPEPSVDVVVAAAGVPGGGGEGSSR